MCTYVWREEEKHQTTSVRLDWTSWAWGMMNWKLEQCKPVCEVCALCTAQFPASIQLTVEQYGPKYQVSNIQWRSRKDYLHIYFQRFSLIHGVGHDAHTKLIAPKISCFWIICLLCTHVFLRGETKKPHSPAQTSGNVCTLMRPEYWSNVTSRSGQGNLYSMKATKENYKPLQARLLSSHLNETDIFSTKRLWYRGVVVSIRNCRR